MNRIELRPASIAHAESIAEIHIEARAVAMPYLPVLHTPPDVRRFFEQQVLRSQEVWVAELEGRVVGFSAVREGWLEHLYVHPDFQSRGVGSALLKQVLSGAESTINLWVFQRNERARRFYEWHGFNLIQTTDGSGNEEKEPDAQYRWNRAD